MESNLDKFASLISDIKFEVNIRESVIEKQQQPQVRDKVKVELNKALQKAKTELASAKKLFKQGKITSEEILEYEWRVYDLKNELDTIAEDESWDDELNDFEGEA